MTELLRPLDLDDTLEMLGAHPDAVILAGGTDLMRGPRPAKVVDLSRVDELRAVRREASWTWVGAGCRVATLLKSSLLARRAPLFLEACRAFGSPQIRARATIGGNIASASPASDLAPALLALDATVEVRGPEGQRAIGLDRFFKGDGQTLLGPGELLVAVRIPHPKLGDTTCFRKVGLRRVQGVAVVSMAARLELAEGQVENARVAFGSMGPKPMRAELVEASMIGRPVASRRAELLRHDLAPVDDHRASADYRRRVATNLLRTWLETLEVHTGSEGSDVIPV